MASGSGCCIAGALASAIGERCACCRDVVVARGDGLYYEVDEDDMIEALADSAVPSVQAELFHE